MSDQTDSSTRIKISKGCAVVGVLLLVLASVLPAGWYPTLPLFLGLALIVVSHVLTPCQDQITRWWRRRISKSPQGEDAKSKGASPSR
jgi:hypothetical protein